MASNINKVSRVSSSYTWAGKPTASSVPVGTVIMISDLSYQRFVSDGTYWRPMQGKVMLYSKWGTLASPIASLSGVTAGVFIISGGAPKVPAGLIIPNSKLYLQADVRKVGANSTAIFNCWLGTAGTTADSAVVATSLSSATNMDGLVTAAARFGTSKTTLNTRNWLGDGTTSASSASVVLDKTTNINTDADMFVTLSINAASASDAFSLIGCMLFMEA